MLFLILLAQFLPLCAGGFSFSGNHSGISIIDANSKIIIDQSLDITDGYLNLKDNTASTISNSSTNYLITLSNGSIKTGATSSKIYGTINPSSTDTIVLNNNDKLDVTSGTILQAISIANGATASIYGQGQFSSAITLGNASSVLQIDMASPLNQSVTGAGKLRLLNDLILTKNVGLPALVEQQDKKLYLDGGTYSTAVTNTTGGIIELGSNISLTNAWGIGSNTDIYTIIGNGNILTMSGSGSITFNGASLYLADIHIKNISPSNNLNGSGNIYLSNTTLELGANYTRSDGSFYVIGDNCKIITNGYTFTISGSGNTITVDGVNLYFEQLDGTGLSPFVEASGGLIVKLNGGDVKATGSGGGSGSPTVITSTTNTLSYHVWISGLGPVHIINTTPLTPKAVSIDGANHQIKFSNKTNSFNLDANVQATLTNVVLADFNPEAVSYGDSNASLTFGDGVAIELLKDLTILAGDKPWTFTGNSSIDGNGSTLRIEKSQGITLAGNKTLTLKNMRLEVTQADAFKALADNGTIILQNVDLILQNAGFNFSKGNLTIAGKVKISGGSITTTPLSIFELSTKGTMTIGENAILSIDQNIKLKYNIDPTNDTTVFASKRHLNMSYAGSMIEFNGGMLESTATGVAFDLGTIQIRDSVTFIASTNTAAEIEISNALRLNLSAGAELNFDGPIRQVA